MSPRKLMSVAEVARVFGVEPRTVQRWADDGKLGHVQRTIGGARRFDPAVVEATARGDRS